MIETWNNALWNAIIFVSYFAIFLTITIVCLALLTVIVGWFFGFKDKFHQKGKNDEEAI